MGRRKNNEKNKENSKTNKLTIFLIIIILICIGVIVYLLFFKKPKESDYPKGKTDDNVIALNSNDKKMDKSEGGGAVALSYSKQVIIDSKTGEIAINFKNPSRSTQSLVIDLVILQDGKENIVATTDRVPPGYAIYKMKMLKNYTISAGNYEGKFNVSYYDEETEEKAIVNTNIPVNITVK